jgi:SAM-dependent methyltransferase
VNKLKETAKRLLRNCRLVKLAYRFYQPLFIGDGSGLKNRLNLFAQYFKDFKKYREINKNQNFSVSPMDSFPCIYDRTTNTEIDATYFYQDCWCAKKVFENRPNHHVDVASKVEMVGIISQFTPTTFIDIRPIDLKLSGLEFKKGNATELPFENDSIHSLSSICVIEHIGLGRYGDPVDPDGSEKALAEFKRVLAQGGNLYLTVPIDKENKIYFNAHRAFSREYILKLAEPLELIEEKYIYGREVFDNYDPQKGFGTGLFYFRKK